MRFPMIYDMNLYKSYFFYVCASKWVQNDPQAQKQLHPRKFQNGFTMTLKPHFLSFFDVKASKWAQNGPQAQKQLQILKSHTFTFPMIYIMVGLLVRHFHKSPRNSPKYNPI